MKDQFATPQGIREGADRLLAGTRRALASVWNGNAWLVRARSYLPPALFGALLSVAQFPFSVYPLGISLVAAAREKTLCFYIGGVLAALLRGEWPGAVGLSTLLCFRFLFSRILTEAPLTEKCSLFERLRSGPRPFCEGDALRLSTASLAAFTAGMLRVVAGGFTFGDLVGTCLAVVICPAIAYLYSGALLAADRRGVRYDIGCVALLCSGVYALNGIRPFGIPLSVAAASFCALALAKCKTPPRACLFALLLILPVAPQLAPALALAGAVTALLIARSRVYAVTLSAISFAALSVFSGGILQFAAAFPAFLAGALLAAPLTAATVEKHLPLFGGSAPTEADRILGYREQKGKESIAEISQAFEALSRTFFELSDREMRVSLFDTRRICDRVCDRHCRLCDLRTLCWERDYAVTLEAINCVSARLYKSGKVEKSDLPEAFVRRCEALPRLLADIERENRRALRAILQEDKTRAFAVDYAVFARVLSEALEKNEIEFSPDPIAKKAVETALRGIGFSADSIGVYGKRSKKVHAFRLRPDAMHCTADSIREALFSALGQRMEAPLFEFADGAIHMICHAAPQIAVQASVASAAGHAEENGDRVLTFAGKNGYWYAMVSDGMGSGSAAARKSGAAAVFLEKMLRAGNSVSAGIEMLSALARSGGEEGFTTLDLFEVDCIASRGSFIKSGAAPSFVRRGNKLFKIRSRTFPIGILEDVDAERTTFALEAGDTVILLSDGVTEEVEEPLWLCEFLSTADLSAPDAASAILAEARRHTLCRDDMTAAVLRVTAAPSA